MPVPQPASRYDSQPASRIVLPPSAVPLRILRNQSVVSAGLFLWKSKKEQAVIAHDREQFIEIEKSSRSLLHMPPYGKLAALIVSSTNQQAAEAAAYYLGKCAPNTELIETLGPAPAPMNLLRGRYRYRLLLKTARNVNIQNVLKKWLAMVKIKSNVRVDVDINPYSFM